MIDKLIAILEQNTPLRADYDLFYLEMPLDKSGLWIEDAQNDNPRTGYTDWNIYYRGKTKSSAKANIKYLQDTINELEACSVNGEIFRLDMMQGWDYLGKDSEGYFVFASSLRLYWWISDMLILK